MNKPPIIIVRQPVQTHLKSVCHPEGRGNWNGTGRQLVGSGIDRVNSSSSFAPLCLIQLKVVHRAHFSNPLNVLKFIMILFPNVIVAVLPLQEGLRNYSRL